MVGKWNRKFKIISRKHKRRTVGSDEWEKEIVAANREGNESGRATLARGWLLTEGRRGVGQNTGVPMVASYGKWS